MSGKEIEADDIDWENPFDDIRSSEVNEITIKFIDNGKRISREDDDGSPYTLFTFKCIRLDVSKKPEITYTTSSKRLIESLKLFTPLKGKSVKIIKQGSNFQTIYTVIEVKSK